MRHLLFFLMSLCAACTAITSCSRTNDTVLAARQQAWLDLILSTHNSSDEKDVCLLDSINRLVPPADRHERVLWQLAQAWLTAAQTNRGVNDSLIVPIVDYLERHGTPAEQTEALLLHARSLEWRGEMEQAQQVYSQALQAALESGDPRMEMRCRQLLTSFYLQRTHLKDEGAQTARRFLQLAESMQRYRCPGSGAHVHGAPLLRGHTRRHALQPPGRRRGAFPPSHPTGCPGQRPILGDAEQIRTGRALHDPPATLRSPAAAEGNQRLPVQPPARRPTASSLS